jgi:hypothetical protein
MYAPVDYDRSLYVFCCNKRTCSLTSEGWIIIRNQQDTAALISNKASSTESDKKIIADPTVQIGLGLGLGLESSLPTLSMAQKPPSSAWGDLSASGKIIP